MISGRNGSTKIGEIVGRVIGGREGIDGG